MRTKLKFTACFAVFAAFLTLTGCKGQPDHPNQINTFDGACYDSLTLAHAALTSLRAAISTRYERYAPEFDQAVESYSTALNAYTLYRTIANNSSQAQVTTAMQNLTLSVVVLENTFETDMNVPTAVDQAIRTQAAQIRAAAGPNASISDILTALEIAASIAETVPAAQPYAALAAVVIAATDAALDAEDAASGQLIDLSTISAIAPI